jgi:hypothetical protein
VSFENSVRFNDRFGARRSQAAFHSANVLYREGRNTVWSVRFSREEFEPD